MPERRERAPSESSAAMGTSAPFAIAARRSSERNLRTRKKVYIPAMGMPKIMITAASPIKLPSIKTLLVGRFRAGSAEIASQSEVRRHAEESSGGNLGFRMGSAGSQDTRDPSRCKR